MKKILWIAALAMALGGCDAPSNDELAVERSYEELPESAVLVRVGERELTKQDLEAYVELQVAQIKNSKQVEKARATFRKRRFDSFPTVVTLAEEAKKRALKADEELATKQLGRYAKLRPQLADFAKRVLDEELLGRALRAQVFTSPVELDENRLQRLVQTIGEYNEKANATNQLTRALLERAKADILSGKTDFQKVSNDLSEDDWAKDGDCEWGTFTRENLDGEDEVLAALDTLGQGEITGPLEGDNGYMLLRLDSKNENGYTLSRIYRRQVALMEDESVDELRTRFTEEEHEKRFAKLAEELRAQAKASYPAGTNLFNQVKKGE